MTKMALMVFPVSFCAWPTVLARLSLLQRQGSAFAGGRIPSTANAKRTYPVPVHGAPALDNLEGETDAFQHRDRVPGLEVAA
jgi:hypothetical protein